MRQQEKKRHVTAITNSKIDKRKTGQSWKHYCYKIPKCFCKQNIVSVLCLHIFGYSQLTIQSYKLHTIDIKRQSLLFKKPQTFSTRFVLCFVKDFVWWIFFLWFGRFFGSYYGVLCVNACTFSTMCFVLNPD